MALSEGVRLRSRGVGVWTAAALCAVAVLGFRTGKCVAVKVADGARTGRADWVESSRRLVTDDDDDDGGGGGGDDDDDDDAVVDEVSMTEKAARARAYHLRKKRRKGFIIKREASLTQVLFPGASPQDYKTGEPITMYTELVESKKTQVPFKYVDLPVCPAPADLRYRPRRKNLGARLQGHSENVAAYDMKVNQNLKCTALCEVAIPPRKVRWMRKLVERLYRVHLTLDQLPVLVRSRELNYALRGYPVGFKAPPGHTGLSHDEFYLYNHLKFNVFFHNEGDVYRITGFDVHPVSIDHVKGGDTSFVTRGSRLDTCNPHDAPSPQNNPRTYMALRQPPNNDDLSVIYSYEVTWRQSTIEWADRWDVYLIGGPDDDIHYFSIVNSLMIVLFLTGAVATILVRALRRDIAGYNEMQTLEEAQEETGWKLVHGDVFRPPSFSPMVLSVAVGTGTQIGAAFLITLLCAIVGLLNPIKKGQTLTAVVVLYVLLGSVSGYVSSRIYKFCDGKGWKQNTLLTAVAFPGMLVGMFVLLNIFLTFAGAATAVSFWLILALFLLWTCVSTPLIFVGSYLGFRAEKIEVPTKTTQIARVVPPQACYSTLPWSMFLGGVLPFGSVCIELFFIMGALWLHQIYYVMGFLLAVLLILATTCSMVSMVMCYLQLCGEDHRWWWKSFLNCASAGFYLFLYSLWYLSSKLDLVGFLPVVVYLTYMSMISIAFALFCGAVGLLSAFWFTIKIYGAVKVD